MKRIFYFFNFYKKSKRFYFLNFFFYVGYLFLKKSNFRKGVTCTVTAGKS